MTRPAVTLLLALTAVAAAVLAAALAGTDDRPIAGGASPLRDVGAPTATPVPPIVSRRGLNRQDRTSAGQRRAESVAHDRRPLLTQLPLTRSSVTINLAGLSADSRRALLTIRHPNRPRRYARTVYHRALRAARDTGHAYQVRYRP